MVADPAASAVYDFENILPQLDFLPIAARRALDHAGLRLSLEAWRSLGLEDRCQLVAAGAEDLVEADIVTQVVRRASPSAQRIEVVGDPDPLAPPDGLLRLHEPVPLDARQWARLRSLDRYALAHVHRRSIARNDPTLIQAAYEDIVTGHLRSLRPPPGEAGGRSLGSTTPPPAVPLPPPLPRADGGRAARGYEATPAAARPHEGSHRGYDTTPAPGRSREPGSSRRGQDLVRGYEATVRPHDPYAHDVPPVAPRGLADTPPSGGVYPGLSRRRDPAAGRVHEAAAGRVHEAAAPAYDPRGNRSSSVPPSSESFHAAPLRDGPELTPLAPDVVSNHLTAAGEAHMVDVGDKPATLRRAVAAAAVHMRRDTFRRLAQRDTPKGDVLAAARIAGIQAAKRTSELIPLCHIVALTSVEVHLELDPGAFCVQVTAVASAFDRTGVEMEALVAASIASLTIYDMLKGLDRDMLISDVKLLEKSGGRTGHYQRGAG